MNLTLLLTVKNVNILCIKMSEIVAILSESSEDTIILSDNEGKETDIDKILKKYSFGDKEVQPTTSAETCKNDDFNKFSDDEWINEPLSKRLKTKIKSDNFYNLSDDDDLEYIKEATNYKTDEEDFLNKNKKKTDEDISVENLDDYLANLYKKYNIDKPKTSLIENEVTTSEKQQVKNKKQQTRLLKQQEKEQKASEKALKEAYRTVEKNLRPDECMKFITVNIDEAIFEQTYMDIIVTALNQTEINYIKKSQLLPNVISWTRTVQIVENGVLISKEIDENNILMLMNASEFVKLVDDNNLIEHIKSIYSLSEVKQLSFGVFGLNDFYKTKNAKKNETKHRVEFALAELQITCSCYFRSLEKIEEIPVFIIECTKSVAQIPFKKQKNEKYEQSSEYYAGVNKDCVRVDKNGNGLSRLWTQILTLFPMARLETAEAITSVYPNLQKLYQAYERCETKEEGEKLLQDLQVRRAAGPFSTVRKIGPELSKKIYRFLWEQDNLLL